MAELTCITEQQRRVHVAAETVALLAVAPLLLWVATQRQLPDWARMGAGVAGVGTLLVDGWLLSKYLEKAQNRTVNTLDTTGALGLG